MAEGEVETSRGTETKSKADFGVGGRRSEVGGRRSEVGGRGSDKRSSEAEKEIGLGNKISELRYYDIPGAYLWARTLLSSGNNSEGEIRNSELGVRTEVQSPRHETIS